MTITTSPAHALADEFYQHRLEHDQETALHRGDVTFLERWPDYSTAGCAARVTYLRDLADRADAAPAEADADRNLADAVAFSARSSAIFLEIRPPLTAINPNMGMVAAMLTMLPRFPLVTADHGARYQQKLQAFPAFVDAWCDRLREAATDGIVPIRHLVERQIEMLDGALSAPLSTAEIGRQAPPTELRDDAAAAWVARTHELLDEDIAAGFRALRATLVDVTLPAALPDDTPGIMHLADRTPPYAQLLWAATSLELDPMATHQVGLEQIARLEDEYRSVAGPLLGTMDLAEIYRRLRDDPELHYRDEATLVADATAALAKATAAAVDWFGRLPVASCTANPTQQGGLAFYSPPTREGTKQGEFFFDTSDPTVWGTFHVESVTYHEGVPGHHLQIALAQELPDLHPILAEYLVMSYSEGWGLYTERLADEMGLYTTALDRIGMLASDSMRACRIVVDTGMHAMGWTRDQAIDYVESHSPLTRGQIEGEVDRYIGWPGQACAYMLGRLEIDAIRATAEARLGDRFDIRSFHDAVLRTGSVPLSTLRRTIEGWSDERALG
jgi:uncharacterized protein (DUF885 family)